MSRARKPPAGPQRLIVRDLRDANFPHMLSLFPMLRHFAQIAEPGRPLGHDEVNMIQMPMEMLEAFIRDCAGRRRRHPLALACREALVKAEGVEALLMAPPATVKP